MSEEVDRVVGPAGATFFIPCPDCGKLLLQVKTQAAGSLDVFFECIPDGVSSLHPLTVKSKDGVILAEWPDAVEYGRPIVFNEAAFTAAMEKGRT